LLDDLEKVLGIGAFPVNWPIGDGPDFKGVYDRRAKQVHLFERTVGGMFRAPVDIGDLSDPVIRERLDEQTYNKVTEELGMLELAGESFDEAAVLAGKTTPVFFGSGVNNFGVQLLLDGFLRHAPGPKGRNSAKVGQASSLSHERVNAGDSSGVNKMGRQDACPTFIAPEHPAFSGFIFKIQANMDPRHRDRIAFLRVCSGKFERDMTVTHMQSQRKVRLSSSHKLFGNERETVDEAYPGDVIGLVGHDGFGIGDTLTTDASITYKEIPRFTPETFAYLHNPNTAKYKQFRQGLDQLLEEGVIQVLHLKDAASKVPLLAAVGPLQFEVTQYRLENEYGAESRLEQAPWTVVRWLRPELKEPELDALSLPTGSRLAFDNDKRPVVLFSNDWSANYFTQTNKNVPLAALPPERAESL